MSGPDPAPGPDPIDQDLRGLLDDERRLAAAASRRRRHWLAVQAEQGGTFAGALVDLGERRVPVIVATRSGRRLGGTVATLGADFVGVRTSDGGRALVRLAAVTVVRPAPREARTVGDRLVEVDAAFPEVLAELAAERPSVAVHTDDGEVTRGRLLAVGHDLVTVAVGDERAPAYVALAGIGHVVLP